MARRLTEKQEMFVRKYLSNGRNGNAAYRAAYDVRQMAIYSIEKEAKRLLKHPLIAPRIEQALKRVEERTEITVERIEREYGRIAFAHMGSFVTWGPDGLSLISQEALSEGQMAAVAEVSQSNSNGSLKIKLHDKKGALDSLARIKGMFIEKT